MPLNDSPLDATIHVVTPENIAFEYRLAGPFRRLPAFLLDLCIGTAIFIGLVIAIGLMISPTSGSLAGALVLLLFFVVWWFYGVLFETFMNGQTPGKYILGLRVLTDAGQPINGMQATLRNLLRAADLLLPMFGLLVMSINRKSQR
ncbi:MAG: RDD family protein, partial [Planctomycetia bacterium]|nr:RDD family protein [Planctomycetia bacterium]